MRPLLLFLMLTCARIANAQIATIRDPDGFTNVHAAAGKTAKVTHQFHDGDVFTYGEQKDGWIKILYWPADSADRRSFEGYIYKDRLQPIDQLRELPLSRKTSANGHLTLHYDTLTIELTKAAFAPKQHRIHKDSTGWIQTIDGKRPLGTDGDMPHEMLTGLRIVIADTPLDIPAAAWGNLYDPELDKTHVYVDPATGYMYVSLANWRSAAGGYDLFWVFKAGRYVRRYVDQSNN